MPLGPNVQANIRELYKNGTKKRPRQQIIAIAEAGARRAKGKPARRRGRRSR